MLFMVIERFRDHDAAAVYRRFRDQGRLAPEGLRYVSSWVTRDLQRCYQVMECDDPQLLQVDRPLEGSRRLRGHPGEDFRRGSRRDRAASLNQSPRPTHVPQTPSLLRREGAHSGAGHSDSRE